MPLTTKNKRRFRQIAHHLQPIVLVGDKGITENLQAEVTRALFDHELVKVKINLDDRDARAEVAAELIELCGATKVQTIGKIVVMYKDNPRANPKLSNLKRYSHT